MIVSYAFVAHKFSPAILISLTSGRYFIAICACCQVSSLLK